MKKMELQQIISDTADAALSACTADNPLIAWANFIDRLDAAGRRMIGDDLERAGKNRFTGEIKKEE